MKVFLFELNLKTRLLVSGRSSVHLQNSPIKNSPKQNSPKNQVMEEKNSPIQSSPVKGRRWARCARVAALRR